MCAAARAARAPHMSHSGPFRCQCGQIHADQYDGPSNDLLPYIDIDGVHALNESETGACRRVFKPYDQRLDQTAVVESEEDDPQIIIHIPFVSPVKIRALKLIGGGNGTAPRILRAYINREALDFTDVEDAPPVQQWDLAEDATGDLEYATQFSRFQNVSKLSLFVPENFGGDHHTVISYIGLSGVGSEHKRRAVQAVYEARGVGNLNDPLREDAAPCHDCA